jgi:hypothetical protein
VRHLSGQGKVHHDPTLQTSMHLPGLPAPSDASFPKRLLSNLQETGQAGHQGILVTLLRKKKISFTTLTQWNSFSRHLTSDY